MNTETITPATATVLAPITFPAVLTDELFERWLDALPHQGPGRSRREAYERDSDENKAATRARVARMYALRCCDAANAFSKALAVAQQLWDAVEDILRLYGPNEGERVLKAAGLPLPGKWDTMYVYGGETFKDAHDGAKKFKRRLGDFIDRIHELQYILPDCLEGECRDEQRAVEQRASTAKSI